MKELVVLIVYGWLAMAVGGFTQHSAQNRKSIEVCTTNNMLVIGDRAFHCVEVKNETKH